jgi:hypothetical protein
MICIPLIWRCSVTSKSKAYAEEIISELKSHFENIPEHRGPQTVARLKNRLAD